MRDNPDDALLQKLNSTSLDGFLIDSEFDKGNPMAKKIYSFTGEKLGQGLAQAATLLSPEAFIFYGGLSNAKHRILDFAEKSMNENLLSFQKGKIKILLSDLPDGEAGILGSSRLNL